ncbi:MAG: hypothetical protein WCT11_02175 [Candidatus Magasanikbacteria bacterium]
MDRNILQKIILYFKKNLKLFFLLFIFFWSVVSVGKCLKIVSSREPLANVQVIINTNDNKPVDFDVAAKLVRAGNNIKLIKTGVNTWQVNAVFVKRIALAFSRSQLSEIKEVTVAIDDKNFIYSQDELLSQWERVTSESFGSVAMDNSAITLASPYALALERSKIPVKKDFFSSIINWRGDKYLTYNTVLQAVLPSIIISFFLYLFYIIVLVYTETLSPTSEGRNIKQIQFDFTVFYVVLFFTFISEYLLMCLIKLSYHPNILNIINQAKEIYLDKIVLSFTPKPTENLQYILGVMFLPFLLLVNYYLSVKIVNRFLLNKLHIINILLVVGTFIGLPSYIYLSLSMWNFLYVPPLLNSVFGFSVYAFLIFPIFSYFLIKNKYQGWVYNTLSVLLAFVLFSVVIFAISSPVGSYDAHHLDAVYFPQTQIAQGKTIIQQVPSLYGLFPLILKPVFDIIGLGIFKFTIVMGVIIFSCYFLILLFLKISTNNKIIPLLGVLNIINYFHLPQMAAGLNYKINYQHLPIRIIFPSLILFISAKYLKNPNRSLYGIGHFVATVAIFWNFDSGLVVFISWNLFLLYLEILKRGDKKSLDVIKSVCKHVLRGIGFLLTGLVLLSFYYIYHFGGLPDISLFFQYSKEFYNGFSMNPLPIFPNMWHLIIFIYTLSLLMSLICVIKNKDDSKAPLYFILSIVGFGSFIYFQGRALNAILFDSSFVSILILALLLDDYLPIVYSLKKTDKYIVVYSCFITSILLFFLLLPSVNIIVNIKYFISNSIQSYKELYYPVNQNINKNINFIKHHTIAGERILILATPEAAYDATYYGETNTVCAIDFPSVVDWNFKYQYNLLLNYLDAGNKSKIFVNSDYNDEKILKILNTKFKKEVTGTGMILFEN